MIRRAIRFAPGGKNPCISWAHGPAHSLCKWPEMRWLHFRPRWLHFWVRSTDRPAPRPRHNRTSQCMDPVQVAPGFVRRRRHVSGSRFPRPAPPRRPARCPRASGCVPQAERSKVRVETRLKSNRSDAWPAVWVSARFCGMVAGPATSWTMKVPMDGGRDRGFEASRAPAERIIGPRPARRKCEVAFSAAMAGASSMRGWSPEPATTRTMKGPYGWWS